MRRIVFFIAVVCFDIALSAQETDDTVYGFSWWLQYDTLQYDTLQTYPYLYKYNFPDTTRYHDGMPCIMFVSSGGDIGYYRAGLGEYAVYQYTESPLTVYGIAFDVFFGNPIPHTLTIYDTAMNVIATDTAMTLFHQDVDSSFWSNVDTTKYKFFTLPGIKSTYQQPLADKIILRFKYFDSSTPPVVLNGGFWVGMTVKIDGAASLGGTIFCIIEDHELPYRINNVRVKGSNRMTGEWLNDTVIDGVLPELFLIVAPPCPAVEGLTAVMDSAGNVDVTWDSSDYHRQWVVELYGPGLSVIDTVTSCHWRYPGLYPSKPYWVRVNARCPGPDNRVWSGWSPKVHFGTPVSVDAAEAALPGFTLSPNPTDGLVTVAADLGNEAVAVSVVNSSGVEVMDLGSVALPVTFDTKGLAAGVYLVRLTTPHGTATRRLVVQ